MAGAAHRDEARRHSPGDADQTRPGPARICVILNAAGGALSGEGAEAEVRRHLETAFSERGIEAVIIGASGDTLEQEARAAAAAKPPDRFDALVVGGGDGSVCAVANVLVGTGMPLAILPLGTLNHFAKDLGLPLDIGGAVDVIAAGATQEVDVAEVNGRVFINNSSVGIYPYMVADRERQQNDAGRGKWFAMALAFFRVLRRFPLRRLSIRGDGWVRPRKTPCVFIGNNAYDIDLFSLGRRAALNRGELCLYVVNHQSPWGLLRLGLRAVFGSLDQAEDFEMQRLSAAEIRSRASRLPVALDGEVMVMDPPLQYRIRPKALRVFAPAARPGGAPPACG